MPASARVLTDTEGVLWRTHVEERREAVLSISRSDDQVARRQYLVFVSEFGHRRRSRDPVADGWQSKTDATLLAMLQTGLVLRAAS